MNPSLPDFYALAQRFDAAGVKAILLMGSHARGQAGPYSDVDLVRLLAKDAEVPGVGSYLIDDHLVVVSNVTPAAIEGWFSDPLEATNNIVGVRAARALIDRDDTFAPIQARAQAFRWDEELQLRADHWASEQMVGLIEEAHKGLEGLRRRDPGRLLNGIFGLSHLLSRVVQVQRGILISGDNGFYADVAAAVGLDSLWVQLRAIAFGVEEVHGRPPSLREKVVAGLHLYVATAELVSESLQPAQEPLVQATVQRINNDLERAYHGEE
jgi:Nucleotidyltransferase domain